MNSLTIAVFGVVVLCATYGPTNSNATEIGPTNFNATGMKEYLCFDFLTAESCSDVTERFKNVIVVQKFKFYGHQRYMFLVENDRSDGLKKLRLPEDAEQVKVVPMETFLEFLSHFGIPWDHREDEALYRPFADGNVTYIEREWNTEDNFDGMEAKMRHGLRGFPRGDVIIFVHAGAMPLKFSILVPASFTDYNVMEILLHYSRLFGGIHVLRTVTYKLHTI